MDSFTSFSTITTTPAYPYTSSTVTVAPSSQQLIGLQFASQVPATDNQQFHHMLQQHQALMLQQQQQQQQPVMYDHRRDSTSSVGGTNRRTQSKAEKRAEHNAIERARREGLNTRFQQLAHLLPNLQHDTKPSKGTIIERTLEFVKDAIQKEDRYRHEIKDLRHTNRQLLKQLTHLTTGQNALNDDGFGSDDQLSIRSPSSSVYPLNNSASSSIGGMSSITSDTPSSSPKPTQRRQKRKQMDAQFIDSHHRVVPQNLHQVPLQYRQANNSSMKMITADQHPTSMQQTSSSSSSSVSSSDVWNQLANSTWFQQSKSSHSPPSSSSSASFHSSSTTVNATSSPTSAIANVTHPQVPNPSHSPLSPQHQHIYHTGLQDTKPFNFDGTMMKGDQPYHGLPDLFASYNQHHITGYNIMQETTRLTSRPASQPRLR